MIKTKWSETINSFVSQFDEKRVEHWWREHYPILLETLEAMKIGRHWQPFSDNLADYPLSEQKKGQHDFMSLLNTYFSQNNWDEIQDAKIKEWYTSERSPYGFDLNIKYPIIDADVACTEAVKTLSLWGAVPYNLRAAILLESVFRLHKATFLFTEVGMHTSGHSYLMGFHASAIHAQYRALEAIARIYQQLNSVQKENHWDICIGGAPSMRYQRTFSHQPLGLSLVICGRIVPTWNSYPSIFASLMAGNPVLIKPHPQAVLPLALTTSILREVITEAGLPASIVTLLLDSNHHQVTKSIATKSDIKLVDYTGNTEMGIWLETHAKQARVFTLKSGTTPVIIHSSDNYQGMLRNLAFGLCSYSAQLCTSPKLLYLPEKGIQTPNGMISFDTFVKDLSSMIDNTLSVVDNPKDILGTLVNPENVKYLTDANAGIYGKVIKKSQRFVDKDYPHAEIWGPGLVCMEMHSERTCPLPEGGITLIIRVKNIEDSLSHIERIAMEKGCLSIGLYTTNEILEQNVSTMAAKIGAVLSINFSGNYFLSQSEVFTDLHGGSINPSSNTGYGEPSFYSSRFRLTEVRKQIH
ncbi:aldehyde dehydrogenase family protein [Xenorhabdus sp. TH1]|uniref:aldehyde dehydrogenase family protein n=1 Tax=Xenorhabdus sp. TH1 TaxID=3130166 RepID=UPI0030CF817D